jgi:hypothetical protein
MSNRRYLELVSAFRNRNEYPNPAEFTVLLAQSGTKTNGLDAYDPISDAFPLYTQTSFPSFVADGPVLAAGAFGGGVNNIVPLPGGSAVDDIYNGLLLVDTTIGESVRIIDYDGGSMTATLESPFSDNWMPTDAWEVRNDLQTPSPGPYTDIFLPTGDFVNNSYVGKFLEVHQGGMYEFTRITAYDAEHRIITVSPAISLDISGIASQLQIRCALLLDPISPLGVPVLASVLAAGVNNTTTFTITPIACNLVGNFIVMITGAAAGDIRLITSYDPTTGEGTVGTPFTAAVTAGDQYELWPFSGDNSIPLNYSGSTVSQSELVCYEIELIDLVLPNVPLLNHPGGRIAFYPYVYVELSNVSSPMGANNIIYTNNPYATRALFRVPIDDVPNPLISTFIRLDANGMIQTIKFKPNDNLHFRVFLPSGETFTTTPYTMSPEPPNPRLQISANFAIKRL